MLKVKLDVVYADGRSEQVVAGPKTQVAFEREHDCSIVDMAKGMRMGHVYWLAWHASHPIVDFDTWLDEVDSIDVEVSTADPTTPALPVAA